MRRAQLSVIVLAIVLLPPCAATWAGDNAAKAAKADSGRAVDAAKRGYWLEAMALWKDALELDPDNAEILNNYAVALEAVGRYEEAGTAYEKALAIDSDRRIRKNYSLNREFYTSYVLREDEKTPDEPGDDEDAVAEPAGEQDAPGRPPEAAGDENGKQGDDDDRV